MRSVEGRNKVDEGTLALGDCEASLAHEGESPFGEISIRQAVASAKNS